MAWIRLTLTMKRATKLLAAKVVMPAQAGIQWIPAFAGMTIVSFVLHAAPEFPRPPELQPNIAFWTRVYGEWTSNQIAITDTNDLRFVYTVVDVPTYGRRDQMIARAKDDVKRALHELEFKRPSSEQGLSGLTREIYLALKDIDRPDKYRLIDGIRAQNGLRNQFEAGYRLSGSHDKEMRARLKRNGLPEELIAIVFVESLFYPTSKSHAGAAGLWQFIKPTAKEYMRINPFVDERYDPIIATDGAIEYLRRAKEKLYAWPIAITSYNYGRAGMQRAMEQVGSNDIVDILKGYNTSRFGFAARNYYAEFLAALDVYQNAKRIFPDVKPVMHWAYEVVELPNAAFAHDIVGHAGVQKDWLHQFNPALTDAARNGKEVLPSGYTLRVPQGQSQEIVNRIASMPKNERERAASQLRARHRANGRQRLMDIVKVYDVFHEQLAKRLGYALNEKPKKGSVILVRSADTRFTGVPTPLFRSGSQMDGEVETNDDEMARANE